MQFVFDNVAYLFGNVVYILDVAVYIFDIVENKLHLNIFLHSMTVPLSNN